MMLTIGGPFLSGKLSNITISSLVHDYSYTTSWNNVPLNDWTSKPQNWTAKFEQNLVAASNLQ
jgi:hypothetical protein